MSRLQLALNVSDLEEATGFYSKLFAAAPAKVRSGYANFVIADPPLKLVLIEDATKEHGSLNHLGVEVETADQVAEARTRLTERGLPAVDEGRVSCCYALQDKFWVEGPGGEPWEVYAVLDDEVAPGAAKTQENAAACCAGRPDLASIPTPSGH